MSFDAERITRILVDAIVRRQGDEVDLVFRYGSRVKGTAHHCSDLDISWVPAHATTWDAITVLVDDILVDCYPIHWSTLEQMAGMGNVSCSILLHGRLVYQRTDEAAARFRSLGERLTTLREREARPAMVRAALERFQAIGYPWYLLERAATNGHLLAALQHAQQIRVTILQCLVLVNQAPIDTRRREEILRLPLLPSGLAASLEALDRARDAVAIRDSVERLLAATRELLLAQQATLTGVASFADAFRGGYPELRSDLQHILLALERGDLTPLGLVSIHHELMVHIAQAVSGVDYGGFNDVRDYEQDLAALGFPDLLTPALTGDADLLRRRVLAFDVRLRAFLQERSVALNVFATPDELERHLRTER